MPSPPDTEMPNVPTCPNISHFVDWWAIRIIRQVRGTEFCGSQYPATDVLVVCDGPGARTHMSPRPTGFALSVPPCGSPWLGPAVLGHCTAQSVPLSHLCCKLAQPDSPLPSLPAHALTVPTPTTLVPGRPATADEQPNTGPTAACQHTRTAPVPLKVGL